MHTDNRRLALSIIIPCYNRQTVVQKAIHSVLQTHRQDIEVIVVDDASDDKSAYIVRDIQDDRVILVQNRMRQKANAARNKGTSVARSEIVTFLDSDDEFLPGRVDRLIGFFCENQRCDILFDSFKVERKGRIKTFSFPEGEISDEALEELLVSHAIPITFSCFSARKSCLPDNFLDESMVKHNDRDFLFAQMNAQNHIFLGNGQDVIKHQTADAMSKTSVGEVSSLDKMVGRHAVFSRPQYKNVLSYLCARSFIKSATRLNARSFLYNYKELKQARHLSRALMRHLGGYAKGKKTRKTIERKFFTH